MSNLNFQLKRTLRFTHRQAVEVKNQLLGRYPDRYGLFDLYRQFSRSETPRRFGNIQHLSEQKLLFPNDNEKVLVYSLSQRGFFSEVNNMINAAIYCASSNTGLVLDSSDFLYKEKMGWEDYFMRFWRDTRPSNEQRLFYLKYRSDLRLWNRIRNYNYEQVSKPEMGLFEKSIFENKRNFTRRIYRFQPGVKAHIATSVSSLNLPPNYAACHIRRGDKVGELKGAAESERIEARHYVDRLLSVYPQMTTLFVCSDSYASVQEIIAYLDSRKLNINVVTTCEPENVGHSTELLKDRFENKYEAVLRLLIDVEVSAGAKYFVGTYSSNMSRFIALRHQDASRCYSMDEEWSAN